MVDLGLSKVGLVQNLRRVDHMTIKKRLVIEHKNLLMDSLLKSWKKNKRNGLGTDGQ